jgi:hypothetical protein
MQEDPARVLRPDRRVGYDRRNLPDLERLDEKLDQIDEIPSDAFAREPRATRQASKKVWSKTRKGRLK